MPEGTDLRILVVGAGAIGGYFGGRLLAAGRDVTFLVRPGRAAALARDGLVITSPCGDLHLGAPPVVTAATLAAPFDLVLLSCKAFDLAGAMQDLAPAVGARTAILPLLNGLLHLDALDARFGAAHVLGGLCAISTTLDAAGRIVHLGALQSLTFGARDAALAPRVPAIAAALDGAGFDAVASPTILLEMWEKFVFLATLAGITSLLRAPVGDIVAAGGAPLVRALLGAARAVAEAAGYPPRPAFLARAEAMLTAEGSPMTASMLRDIRSGRPIEAAHILGDLLHRHEVLVGPAPDILRAAHVHAAAYESQRRAG